MKQTYRTIPIYTADVSGVCSALYELGGMVVMHDSSGCNSTYNTHDEIRWYDQDSLIYISALTELDAIMGNDQKLVREIIDAARELHPNFISLCGSPIPYINGTDFPALARLIERETGIITFAVSTNGMHDYVSGAGMALEALLNRAADPKASEKRKRTLNLLGVTPLDFGPQKNVDALCRLLEQGGWEINTCLAMGDSFASVCRVGNASVNLVVSSVGLRAAQLLKERCRIPMVVGRPVGDFTPVLLKALERAERTGLDQNPLRERTNTMTAGETPDVTLIGEPIAMEALAAAIGVQCGCTAQVLCPLELHAGLLADGDLPVQGEEGAEDALKQAKRIIADPLYRPVCPESAAFYPLPHLAFSGRIYIPSAGNSRHTVSCDSKSASAGHDWSRTGETVRFGQQNSEDENAMIERMVLNRLAEERNVLSLIDRLRDERALTRDEWISMFRFRTKEAAEYLFSQARSIQREHFGNRIYTRGLIEFTNYCKNDCYYCGIRRSNHAASRYRLSEEDILSCCADGYRLGFRTFVLQGGEDGFYSDDAICAIVRRIRGEFPDCAVTLSIGERSRESYQKYFDAGAERYLLRHETADPVHYRRLHPPELSGEYRKDCLRTLKEIGYQVGCGFMVGSPGQTAEELAEDMLFIRELEPHMVGIGPFIPHHDTPFAKEEGGTLELTLYCIGLLRLMLPQGLIPATTALGTISPIGRELGVKAGANVIMPNLSPVRVRKKYELYDNKICTGEEAAECRFCLDGRMRSIGYELSVSRGDHPGWKRSDQTADSVR